MEPGNIVETGASRGYFRARRLKGWVGTQSLTDGHPVIELLHQLSAGSCGPYIAAMADPMVQTIHRDPALL